MAKAFDAKPWARGIFELATTQYAVEAWNKRLLILAALMEHREFARRVTSRLISPTKVSELFASCGTDLVDAPARGLVELLASNHRLNGLAAISRQYQLCVDRATGVADVTIYSAQLLDKLELERLLPELERLFGIRARAFQQERPELLGGVVARVGDRVYDASLTGRWKQLFNQF